MKKITAAVILSVFISACQERSSLNNIDKDNSDSILYDEDTRQEVENHFHHSELAEATAIMIESENFKKTPNSQNWTLKSYKLKDSYPLCSNENFLEQPTLGYCTGVLIGKDLVLTAGHCLITQADCQNTKLIFNWNLQKANQSEVSKDEVFACQQLLKREVRPSEDIDYAVIRLDRPVEKTKPVRLANQDTTKEGDVLLSLSHPLGLPLKMDKAKIISNHARQNILKVNVDTFSGSSGSPLFNSQGEVVGILSRGMPDFDEDEIYRVQREGGCLNFHSCQGAACLGENFFKVNRIKF